MDPLNSTILTSSGNIFQTISRNFKAQNLVFDSNYNPSWVDVFSATDLPNKISSMYIEDYMLLKDQTSLGVIKLINNTFVTFRINSPTSNTYFHKRTLTKYKTYYFD